MSTINLIKCIGCGELVDESRCEFEMCDDCIESIHVADACKTGACGSCPKDNCEYRDDVDVVLHDNELHIDLY